MTDALITEATEKPATKLMLEVWGRNEAMRHVPPLDSIVRKLDGDLRQRIQKLCAPLNAMAPDDPHRPPVEELLRSICRAIDRVAESARHSRPSQPLTDLGERISAAIGHAISSLNALDPALFGRRCPFHVFDRSRSEPVYGALLAVISQVQRLTALMRTIDPAIDERLLDGLVILDPPLRLEKMSQ
jgi:hypothetical protein